MRLMMRVPAILTAILLCCPAPALAQGFSMGVKGGVNFADVTFDQSGATSPRWFPVAGLFATLPPHWGVTLQPEVLYSMKGARLDAGGAPTSLLLDYVEMPVLGRVSMTAFGRRVYVAGGPTFAFRVRARTRSAFSGVTEEIDIGDELRRFDLGIAGGGGVEFGALVFDARYTFGLTDIDKDKTDAATAHNRVLSLTGGWRF
jgi:outer membrane protein with beta-barrel domain